MSYTDTTYLAHPFKFNDGVVMSTEEINLKGNSMTCINPRFFNDKIWPKLRKINLSNNNLGLHSSFCGGEATNMLEFSEHLTSVEVLDLSQNTLTDFTADISNLHNLVKLGSRVTQKLENLNKRSLRLKKSKVNLILENNSFKCICECLSFYFWLSKTLVTAHLLNSDLTMARQQNFVTSPQS